MKLFKKSTAYLVAAICAGVYFTFAEAGKPNGEPFSLGMLFLGFWMLGSSYDSAGTMEHIEALEYESDDLTIAYMSGYQDGKDRAKCDDKKEKCK